MKKILSFVLCAAMLLSAIVVFGACNSGLESTVTASDAKAQTLVITAIKDEKTSDDSIKAIENALNVITKAKFNTNVVLKFFTPDEYASNVLAMSQRLEAAQQSFEDALEPGTGSSVPDTRYDAIDTSGYTKELNGDYTYKDQFGRPVTVYPPVGEDQLDIIFIDSLSTYYQLLEKKYIISLSADLAKNPTVEKYISGAFLSQLRTIGDLHETGGSLYAIPNNYVARDYDYILVNKKLYDYYNYDINCDLVITDGNNPGGCDDLADFIYFMKEVAENNDALPDDLKVDKVLYNFTGYQWESYYGDGTGRNTSLVLPSARTSFYNGGVRHAVGSVFGRTLFKRAESFMYSLRSDYDMAPYEGECFFMSSEEEVGYPVPAPEMKDNRETFAVAMISGDDSVSSYYSSDDYYVVRTSSPIVDNTMFSSMFAVSTFSSTAVDGDGISMQRKIWEYDDQLNPRCFEIITMLQTDEEVVNLLSYGIRNVDYDSYENDDTFYNVGKGGYVAMPGKMGNLFLTHPSEGMDSRTAFYAKDGWKAAKMQNRYVIASPYCGMYLHDVEEEGITLKTSEIDRFMADYYAESMEKIRAFDGTNDSGKSVTMEEYISSFDSALKKTDEYKMAMQEYKQITEEYEGPTYESLPLPQYSWFYVLVTTGNGGFLS